MKSKYCLHICFTFLISIGLKSLLLGQQGTEKINNLIAAPVPQKGIKYIGFDTQDSAIVTSSISTIKGEELLTVFNTHLANKLNGRLAGLTVTQGGNEPGFNAPGLYARGRNSYQNTDQSPLVIIDGFIGNFEQLVPEEIEEISLLKDASATAIYGFRGANGVLLITTRRGREAPLSISFSAQSGFSQASALPKRLNSFEYATLYNEASVNDGRPAFYSDDALEAYKTGSDPVLFPDVDWYSEVLRKTAPVSNYNLNFRGGTNTVGYFVSLNAISNQGLYKRFGDDDPESSNSTYNRYNIRSNVDIKINKRFTASLLLGASVEDKFNPYQISSNGTFNALSLLPPNAFPVRVPNGSSTSVTTSTGTSSIPIPDGSFAGSGLENPVANLSSTGFVQYNARTFLSNFKLNHELDFITKGLSISGSVAFNNYFQSGSSKTKQVQRYIITNNAGTPVYSPAIAEPNLILGGSETYPDQNRFFGIQGNLNYKRSFGNHDIAALVMVNTDNYEINRTQPTTSAANNAYPYKTNGGGSRLTYVNNKKYIAELSLGWMGSENFHKDNRYGFFPAASVGWIASNERFLADSKVVSFLKVRASYGLAGNDNIGGRFLFEQRYPSGASYVFGTNTGAFSLVEGRLANPNITWEKEKKANLGIDASFLNQFTISLDLFNHDRYDILPEINSSGDPVSNGTIPTYIGFNDLPFINQGKVNNKGFELQLGYNSKQERALQFFANANVFYSKNKIVFNAEAVQVNPGQLKTGLAIGTPQGLVALGLFQSQEEVDNSPKPIGANARIGDIRYLDIGGPAGVPDGIIDGNDNQAIGKSSVPDFTVGLHTGLKYKGFDLDIIFQGVTGRSVFLNSAYFNPFQNANGSASAIALERWTPENTNAEFPRLSLNGNQNNYRFSSFYERDGSFIKIRSAELGYSIPLSIVSRVKLNSGRVFLNATNLLSLDRISYLDPEALGTGYPPLRTITLGVRVGL